MKKLKILMICAHPGDAFDDSGGTLCHHAMRGDEVTVCLMTSGTRSHAALFTDEKRKSAGERNEAFANMDSEAITGYKEREIIAACKELGRTRLPGLDGGGSCPGSVSPASGSDSHDLRGSEPRAAVRRKQRGRRHRDPSVVGSHLP